MPTLLILYPAYGAVSCHEVSRWAEKINGLRLVLADEEPTTSGAHREMLWIDIARNAL